MRLLLLFLLATFLAIPRFLCICGATPPPLAPVVYGASTQTGVSEIMGDVTDQLLVGDAIEAIDSTSTSFGVTTVGSVTYYSASNSSSVAFAAPLPGLAGSGTLVMAFLSVGGSNSHDTGNPLYNATIGNYNLVVESKNSLAAGWSNEFESSSGLLEGGFISGNYNTVWNAPYSAAIGFNNSVFSGASAAIGKDLTVPTSSASAVIVGNANVTTPDLSFAVATGATSQNTLYVYQDRTVRLDRSQGDIRLQSLDWPAWWSSSPSVLLAGAGLPADRLNTKISRSIVNLGQLKNMAAKAKAHFDQYVPGGAGSAINTLVAGFSQVTPNNNMPCNLGQLKAVASPFYDRYRTQVDNAAVSKQFDYSLNPQGYPWTENGANPLHNSPVTMEQLWRVFTFDASGFDADGDGLPWWWEECRARTDDSPGSGLNGIHGANGDSDCDGWTNIEEYQMGFDPQNYDPGNLSFSASNVLVVYNSNSQESMDVKDHYVANRPGFSQVDTKGYATTTGEFFPSTSDFNTQLGIPVRDYIKNGAGPPKPVKFVVLCHDIPTRITGSLDSVAYALYKLLAAETTFLSCIFPTHLVAASKADVIGYIDRIANQGVLDGVFLKGNGNNVNYLVDDVLDHPKANVNRPVLADAHQLLLDVGVTSNHAFLRPWNSLTPDLTFGENIAGYWSHGGYNTTIGDNGVAAGNVTFTGDCWYIFTMRESFNGQIVQPLEYEFLTNYLEWFAPRAFIDSEDSQIEDYANVPIGAVASTEHPVDRRILCRTFLSDWHEGDPFAHCAWCNRDTTPSFLPIGDPLTRK